MSVRRVSHLGLAVRDLDAAVAAYEAALGVTARREGVLESEGIEAATFHIGDVEIELMQPTGGDTPVGRFIAKRGEGIHHVAYEVDDVQESLDGMRAAGLEVAGEARPGLGGRKAAFVHPRSLHGVLTELVEPADPAG